MSDIIRSSRAMMWRQAGIERHQQGLQTVINSSDFWLKHQVHGLFRDSKGWQLQNMLLVGNLIARTAQTRTCSVGTHLRSDSVGEIDHTHLCIQLPKSST